MSTELVVSDIKKIEDALAADVAILIATSVEGAIPAFTKEEICATWGITEIQYDQLMQTVEFRTKVQAAMYSLKKSADHLAVKAQKFLELMLDETLPKMIGDEKVSPADKIKAMEMAFKISGVAEKNKAVEDAKGGTSGPTVPSINIILTTAAPVNVEKVIN